MIYGEDGAVGYISRVQNMLETLYVSYGGSLEPSYAVASTSSSSGGVRSRIWHGFDQWYDGSQASNLLQSELETYLKEPKLPLDDEHDVLKWWSLEGKRLPILQKIARDILAIPATTVASESAFSLGGRIIDETRSRLSPNVIEALVVTTDWIPSLQEKGDRIARDEVLGAISEGDESGV